MPTTRSAHWKAAFFCALAFLAGCNSKNGKPRADHPRLTSGVTSRDLQFHSSALNRDMPYRVILPAHLQSNQKLQTVYLLHGSGGDFREWSNDSDVAQFAEDGLLLVMPEGESSYYTNSASRQQDRFEDYIVSDLVADVESRFPVATGRANHAAIGISMGGFGAIKIALRHPEIYAFVGGMSSAIDVPRRSFSVRRIDQWRHYNEIFGPKGSPSRRDNDPFVLIRTADPGPAPYFFLTCGDKEGLLPSNREFAAVVEQRHFRYEFHILHGGHDWNQWNPELAEVFRSLILHLGTVQ